MSPAAVCTATDTVWRVLPWGVGHLLTALLDSPAHTELQTLLLSVSQILCCKWDWFAPAAIHKCFCFVKWDQTWNSFRKSSPMYFILCGQCLWAETLAAKKRFFTFSSESSPQWISSRLHLPVAEWNHSEAKSGHQPPKSKIHLFQKMTPICPFQARTGRLVWKLLHSSDCSDLKLEMGTWWTSIVPNCLHPVIWRETRRIAFYRASATKNHPTLL